MTAWKKYDSSSVKLHEIKDFGEIGANLHFVKMYEKDEMVYDHSLGQTIFFIHQILDLCKALVIKKAKISEWEFY